MSRDTSPARWAPLFVLGAGLLATVLITLEYSRALDARNRFRFHNQVLYIESRITDRVESTVALLRGGAGLFAAVPGVDAEAFRAFVMRVRLGDYYPGIQGIGWSRRLPPEEKDALERAMRARGAEGFHVWPEGARGEYHAILFLEPQDRRNRAALGYDMFTDPTRRAAMERARDEGVPVASGMVTLVQEIDGPHQAGYLIYVPVYEGGAIPYTLEGRRARLSGFVYSPIRVGDFLNAVFARQGVPEVGFEVYDGHEARPDSLMYRYPEEPVADPRFTTMRTITVAGRPWTLAFASRPEFERQTPSDSAALAAVGGALLSLLLAGITWAQVMARRRADETAANLRHSEHELGLQREWFRTTLASIGDAVIATDLAGRVTYLNAMAQALTGWPRDEAIDRPLEEVFRIVNEATHEPRENPISLVLRHGSAKGLANHTLLIARDGTERPIDDSAAPIRDEAGNMTGVVLIFRDVTERRRVEEARQLAAAEAKRSQERLHFALEAAHMAVWEWDIQPGVVRESKEMGPLFGREAGWSHADYQSLLADVYREDRERVDRLLAQAIVDCVEFETEFRVLWPDGSVHWLGARGQVLCDEGGRPVTLVGVLFDIDARKQAEEALKESARSKDVFLATLAHELRNPLATISNALHVMKLAGSREPALERLRRMATRQMEHLVRLVDDMLEVSRMTQGKIRLVMRRVELSSVVNDALEASRSAIASGGHRLSVTLHPEPLYIDADPVRITQVIANLLNNAAKYTHDNGYIWLTTERDGDQAVVRVRDNGIGIAPEMLPRIFDLFVQGDSTPGQTQGGMGIGLTLVRTLVEMHGGGVEARSGGVGQGSEFIVRLPLASPPRTAGEEVEVAETSVPATGQARRVLVVDDNRDSAESVGVVVEMLGHQVQLAHNGPAALEKAAAFRPEVVLLDIGLPGMDGYEVARRLRQVLPDAVLAAMTGWGGEEDRRRCQEAGFDHHLLKPVDMDALGEVLAHHRGEG